MVKCVECALWQSTEHPGAREMARRGYGTCSAATDAESRARYLYAERSHECAKHSPAQDGAVERRREFIGRQDAQRDQMIKRLMARDGHNETA